MDAPGASDAAGQLGTGAVPVPLNAVSATWTEDTVTLPRLVAVSV